MNSGRVGAFGTDCKYVFSLGWGTSEPIDTDVLTACEYTEDALATLVEEVLNSFPHLSPEYFLDAKTLKEEGLTVEDVERTLGLPAGWILVEGYTDQQRLDTLRGSF
ncbi:MAG TPA: hypothetical protein VFP17_05910 [Solirubrobacterales bacterium]|nr:hypothetical protein [Solirubrobacterales bacterium]